MSSLPPFDHAPTFKLTQSPNPDFQVAKGTQSEFAKEWKDQADKVGFTTVDTETANPQHLYRLLIGGVIPRPIAFVSSIAEDGTENLAPFSYFTVVSSFPPLLAISFANSPTKPKDTCANILATNTFTVNIISEPFVEQANFGAVDSPRNVDEWFGSGLTKEKSTLIKPARVKESAFSMECELYQSVPLVDKSPNPKPAAGVLILGLVKLIHIRNDVLVHGDHGAHGARDFSVDGSKLRAVSRLGGITYGRIGDTFELPRPNWSDVKSAYEAEKKDAESAGKA